MKLLASLVSFGLLSIANGSFAQPFTLFNTNADIDIANIKASHLVHGDMWWDPASATPRCEFPKGSGKHVGFATQIVMGGYDPTNTLRVSAQSGRRTPTGGSDGTDFWPGPIDPAATTAAQRYASSQKWAKIWKINSKQIDTFLSISTHTVANTPVPIMEWPAKGNPYAKGAVGATLTISSDMAPFVDVNSDGQYDPLAGDYPKIKGAQMLWWIINDDGPTHNISSSLPLKMEVKMSAYAYLRGTVADNIIFYEYELTNKSGMSLSNFRLGISTDASLGYAFDDYMGFDSTLRIGVVYNGLSYDGNGGSGHYGANPPMMGIAFLDLPGDAGSSYVPTGSFGYIINPAPTTPQQHYNTLNFTYPNSRYGFSLDSECVKMHEPGDRRFVMASSDLTFSPGETKKIAAALVVCSNAGGCPNMDFTCIRNTTDTARDLYRRVPQTTSITPVAAKARLSVYPNPATNMLYVETGDGAAGRLSIFDALGKSISLIEVRKGARIDVNTSTLPAGVYSIRYQSNGQILMNMFVKE